MTQNRQIKKSPPVQSSPGRPGSTREGAKIASPSPNPRSPACLPSSRQGGGGELVSSLIAKVEGLSEAILPSGFKHGSGIGKGVKPRGHLPSPGQEVRSHRSVTNTNQDVHRIVSRSGFFSLFTLISLCQC